MHTAFFERRRAFMREQSLDDLIATVQAPARHGGEADQAFAAEELERRMGEYKDTIARIKRVLG